MIASGRKIFITLLLVGSLQCFSFGDDWESDAACGTADEQMCDVEDSPLPFVKIFLMSSALNDAYEVAIEILDGTTDGDEIGKFIFSIDTFVASNPDVHFKSVEGFLNALKKINSCDVKKLDPKQRTELENYLAASYKMVVRDLNNYISEEQ